jgi:hypothetical protein
MELTLCVTFGKPAERVVTVRLKKKVNITPSYKFSYLRTAEEQGGSPPTERCEALLTDGVE